MPSDNFIKASSVRGKAIQREAEEEREREKAAIEVWFNVISESIA